VSQWGDECAGSRDGGKSMKQEEVRRTYEQWRGRHHAEVLIGKTLVDLVMWEDGGEEELVIHFESKGDFVEWTQMMLEVILHDAKELYGE